MAFSDWSTTAGSNTSVGGVSIAENMNPSDVNNAMRAIMADARGALATQSTLAAGTTTDLGSVVASTLTLTGGAATITGFGTISAGVRKRVISNAAHVLTHNATSLICPGGANITLASGDVFDAESLGSGNWRVFSVFRISGVSLIGSTLELATMQASTSGTAINFTGIPAGVKEIVVMFDGVSLSGAANFLVQLGDTGGLETSGYVGLTNAVNGANISGGAISSTAGFPIAAATASRLIYGSLHLTLMDAATNTWVGQGVFYMYIDGTGTADFQITSSGRKALSATLDRVSVVSSNGSDTFDAGNINIAYK